MACRRSVSLSTREEKPSPLRADMGTTAAPPGMPPRLPKISLASASSQRSTLLTSKTSGGGAPSAASSARYAVVAAQPWRRACTSTTDRRTCEACTRSLARRMPSSSTTSLAASRMPAVSARRTAKPPTSMATSTTSLVVPGSSDTIAACLSQRRFRMELLPALGGPAMETATPSRRSSPRLPSSRWVRMAPITSSTRRPSACSCASISPRSASSPKSIHASTAARARSSSRRQPS
mmetsp:Transcript_1283/g.4599  ORF Transcript_1283/g.4599 Transcript_1283/m.4599 type:complete len:236 (+) Transcript_1283:253-960(+)